jgi:hypothetical protein
LKKPSKISDLPFCVNGYFWEIKINMKSKIFILLVIIIPLLFSCKESPCDLNTNSLLQIGFYTTVNHTATSTADLITIYGIGKEGDYLYKDSSATKVFLPLSQNQDSSSFVIKSSWIYDTLLVNYTRHLKLISKECGFATIFEISKIHLSGHKFDSLKVTNDTVSTNYEENIKIFF